MTFVYVDSKRREYQALNDPDPSTPVQSEITPPSNPQSRRSDIRRTWRRVIPWAIIATLVLAVIGYLAWPRWSTPADIKWRKHLTDMEYYVTRQKGTERAFSGRYWDNKRDGLYRCVCCNEPLFDSSTKFDSQSGWPSFFAPVNDTNVESKRDLTNFMIRTEVVCSNCDAHLGHVFEDGPDPTGLRYCINSAALDFEERVEPGD